MAKKTLNKLISSVKKILSTGDPTDSNKLISDSDKVSTDELNNLVNSSTTTQRQVTVVSAASLSERDSSKLLTEERQRRNIDDARRLDVDEAQKDEMERRLLFDDKVQLMKDEYQLFLKNNYPNVVGERQIKDSDISAVQTNINQRKVEIEVREAKLKDRIVERLEREKRRKVQESKLTVNKVTSNQRFFESEVETEYEEKLVNNPEIENLTDVQLTLKQISDLEQKLGRKIISHRDLMERPESDFSINTKFNPNDILIIKERTTINE